MMSLEISARFFKIWILFVLLSWTNHSNLNVSIDFVSGNIEILGKQNSPFNVKYFSKTYVRDLFVCKDPLLYDNTKESWKNLV